MPKKCNVYGCWGNHRGEPYTKVVSFPTDEVERNRWIEAMPNESSSLLQLKQIYDCIRHFDSEWITVKGRKRPSHPPSIFPGISKSCLKQVSSAPRTTTASAETRAENERLRIEVVDKIDDFSSFCNDIQKHIPKDYRIVCDTNNIYISKTDAKQRSVIQFLHLQFVKSSFEFLYLKCAEKNGKEVPKTYFSKACCLQKNTLLSKWSQFHKIMSCITVYEFKDADYLKSVLQKLSQMSGSDLPHFQFVYSQLQLLLTHPEGRRFDKNLYVLAAEHHSISPAAYRMLRKSGSVVLPRVKLLKKLLSCSLYDKNLEQLFQKLKPQQRLVNIFFDKIKLTETLRYSGGRVVGYAQNGSCDSEVLVIHALVNEVAAILVALNICYAFTLLQNLIQINSRNFC